MKEQSSRTFFGIFTILLLVFVSFSAIHPAHAATSSTGIVIPLYTYPTGGTWDQIVQVKKAHPSVPIIAVINPSDGPGPSIDSNYVTGVQKLKAAGVMVLGYVHTGFGYGGLRSPSVLENEISNYKTWYNPNGIFFDEMANIVGDENYYTVLSTYAKSLGFTYTMGNPGTSTLPSYIGTVDNIVIHESSSLPTISQLTGWYTQYSKSNFSYIAIGISSLNTAFELQSSQYVGYLYITNDGGSNPYDTLPSYFGNEVAVLDTGSTTTVPTAPTSLTSVAISSSQINLSWIASNDGGSPVIGYQIDRSTNSSSTWSTIVSNTGSTATTYSDTGLSLNTTYTYRVSAINGIGTSAPSNVTSATTFEVATAPGSPTGLAATAVSSSQINLSWAAPSSDGGSPITGYMVERSTNGSITWSTIVSSTGSTATTYSDTGLSLNTTDTYRVSAINLVGTSTPSNTASATTNAATSTLTVNSQDSSGNIITGYYTRLAANNGTQIAVGFTPYNFTLINTQNYFVHVANYGRYVFSNWLDTGSTNANRTISISSNESITAVYKVAPQPPTGLTATAVSSSQINLFWNAPSNYGSSPITSYEIKRSTDGSTWSVLVRNTHSTDTTYSDTGLATNATSYYRVFAINDVGTSTPSNTASATTSISTS